MDSLPSSTNNLAISGNRPIESPASWGVDKLTYLQASENFKSNCGKEEWNSQLQPKTSQQYNQFPQRKMTNGPFWPVSEKCDISEKMQLLPFDKRLQRFVMTHMRICNGTFVEIESGGGSKSVTEYLESSFSWKGLCVDGGPNAFMKLNDVRKTCKNHNLAVANSYGVAKYLEFEKSTSYNGWWDLYSETEKDKVLSLVQNEKVNVFCPNASTLQSLLSSVELNHIDYLAVNVINPKNVLDSVDWTKTTVSYVSIEVDQFHSLKDYMKGLAYDYQTMIPRGDKNVEFYFKNF
eukprot:TRINITY_DN121_c0_g1_i1.p1 TRINITY_DN121_c0_g1~~TRINITY_DN121_c0_g1_i1.p1  ORF type:complete len:292 (-),score=66.82 TRINITY_DN121_c0_g1_i1:263-1138(-)